MAPPTTSTTESESVPPEVARRRTIAVISHPDAGKTTLTENLLADAGVVSQAGQVKSKRGRQTTTDWMAMERERGISVTSAAVRIETESATINLLDTPGHGDFSEDTYRVLSAVDAAIMLLDASKGIEEQTRRLFEVCRARNTPIITFINKMDRVGLDPLELLHEIETDLDLVACPLTWPVGEGKWFRGVVTLPDAKRIVMNDEITEEDEAAWTDAYENGELAHEAADGFDRDRFLSGEMTPVVWGAAVKGWGTHDLLGIIEDIAPAPQAMADAQEEPRALDAGFSGFIFKLQSNMDPRHRDVAAFIRITSGRFERGMKATIERTGRPIMLAQAQEPFGRDRSTVEEAWPGDVIVLPGANDLRIGDTLFTGDPVAFPKVRVFAPSLFREVVNTDTGRRKQFQRGLEQLSGEGVVQLLSDPKVGMQRPIAAAGGELQFQVFEHRMTDEFGASVRLDQLPYQASAQMDDEHVDEARGWMGVGVYRRDDGTPLALFPTTWALDMRRREHPDIKLDDVLA